MRFTVILEEYGGPDHIRIEVSEPNSIIRQRPDLEEGLALILTPKEAAILVEKLSEALRLLRVVPMAEPPVVLAVSEESAPIKYRESFLDRGEVERAFKESRRNADGF